MKPVRVLPRPGSLLPGKRLPDSLTLRGAAALAVISAAFIFHLGTSLGGLFSATPQRAIHWLLFGSLVFLLAPPGSGRTARLRVIVDVACIAGLAAATMFLLLRWEDLAFRLTPPGGLELVLGGILILVTLEAARRSLGLFLPLTAALFLAYAMAGPFMPGLLKHKGYSLARIISYLYTTSSGIYGIPIGISSTYIILFVFFGSFLNATGAGKLLMKCSLAVTGRFVGGAAKTAVLASAMMGTISGSSIANAVTTGTITIPLMKKSGFDPDTACAVEAVASTGGMLMPPVMGAAAFLMAEYLHVSYARIIQAAFLPALVYFASVYFTIDFYARKHGIGGTGRTSANIGELVRRDWHLVLPIVGLVYFLLRRYSPMTSVVWALLILYAVTLIAAGLRRMSGSAAPDDTGLTPTRCVKALMDSARNGIAVASACAASGIILGMIGLTGIGSTLSTAIFSHFHDFLPGALAASMVISLVLGMGMPATAVYLILATLAAPSLIQLGVDPLAAHMFVFYFGIVSAITPPVALTAYAAAAVGGGNSVMVGFRSFVLGIAAYSIPYVLVYAPEMMVTGSLLHAGLRFCICIAAVYSLALALVGFIRVELTMPCRVLAGMAGLLLITPNLTTDLAGLCLLALVLFMHSLRKARA